MGYDFNKFIKNNKYKLEKGKDGRLDFDSIDEDDEEEKTKQKEQDIIAFSFLLDRLNTEIVFRNIDKEIEMKKKKRLQRHGENATHNFIVSLE